jgi:hypothetical protein
MRVKRFGVSANRQKSRFSSIPVLVPTNRVYISYLPTYLPTDFEPVAIYILYTRATLVCLLAAEVCTKMFYVCSYVCKELVWCLCVVSLMPAGEFVVSAKCTDILGHDPIKAQSEPSQTTFGTFLGLVPKHRGGSNLLPLLRGVIGLLTCFW